MRKNVFVALLAGLSSLSAFACPSESLRLMDDRYQAVSLGSSGLTTVVKSGDDILSTIRTDANPGLTASAVSHLDGGSQYQVKLVSQNRDAGGIISSTYDVTRTNASAQIEETKRYRIYSNYIGDGMRAKGGCGGVEEISR